MDLNQAIKRQIGFCEEGNRYKCGIFVTSQVKKEVVDEILKKIIPQSNLQKLRISRTETDVVFLSGNIIRVVIVNDSSRGYRFNGAIVDNKTKEEVINRIIVPHLMPLNNVDGTYKQNDDPMDRFVIVNISWDDVREVTVNIAVHE